MFPDAGARKARLKVALKDGTDSLMEFSPDGKVLALADDESLRLIDIVQGKVRGPPRTRTKSIARGTMPFDQEPLARENCLAPRP